MCVVGCDFVCVLLGVRIIRVVLFDCVYVYSCLCVCFVILLFVCSCVCTHVCACVFLE